MRDLFPIICVILPLLEFGLGMKVVHSDGENPQSAGFTEILNSSLASYPEFSLCGRLLSHYFSTEHANRQVVLSVGQRPMLASQASLPCEQNYQADPSTPAQR